MKRRIGLALFLAFAVTLALAIPVFAIIYRASYTVSENGTATSDYAMLGVMEDANNQWMADNGFMNASANDTRIETLGGLYKPHMMTDDKTLTAIPVPVSSQTNLYFTTGNTEIDDFYIIPGYSANSSVGYISFADDNTYLELGENFTVEQSGWIDTSTEADWALYFNGTSDFAEKTASVTAQSASLLTVEAWFNTDTSGAIQAIVACGDWAAFNFWGLRISAADKINFVGGNLADSAFAFDWTSTNTTSINTWHYAMATYNSAAAPEVVVYIDGKLWAGADAGDGTAMAKPTTYLEVGCYDNAHTGKFSGYIDEIRVSESVRTASEAETNWNDGVKTELADDANTIYLFHFNEGIGTITYDETANNNDLAITGAEWYGFAAQNLIYKKDAFLTYVSGIGNITSSIANGGSVTATGVSSGQHTVKTTQGTTDGGHIYCSGSGDYIDCGDSDNLSAATMLSVECWMKGTTPTVFSSYKIFASKYYHSTAREWVFFTQRVGSYDEINFGVFDQSTGANRGGKVPSTDNISIWDGVAHHIVVTWDGDISNPCTGITFYIDSVSANYTDGSAGAFTAIEDTTQPVYIGRQGNLTARDWRDYIDSVRIYNRELSAAEVAQHFAGTFTDESSLVGLWHIDEDSGTTVWDASGEDNTGTIMGSDWSRQANNLSGQTNSILEIYVDNVLEDVVGATPVPNTSDNWSLVQNNVMPYSDNHTVWVGGVKQLWFRPTSMILGTTLPDRQGGDNPGTFHWGSNPEGVLVSLGSLVSSSQPRPGVDADRPTQDILPEVEVTDWFLEPDVSGTLLTNPLRPFVTIMSDTTTLTEQQAWMILGFAFVLFAGLSTAKALRGHLGITGIVVGAVIGLLVAWTIFPMWALVFTIGSIIGGLIMERSPSL